MGRVRSALWRHLFDRATIEGTVNDLIRTGMRLLADAGRLDGLLTAIAINGKWLRGVLGRQVKLFAAMLRKEKAIIGQVRVPDDTIEVTQLMALLDDVDMRNAASPPTPPTPAPHPPGRRS